MPLSTFADLKNEIADYLDNDGLSDKIETFIRLAEARHERDIRVRQMITRTQSPFIDRYLALPDDFLEMRGLRILTNPVTVPQQISFHEMNRVRSESYGKPAFFTVHDDIEFDKSPDSLYTAEMVYYAKFEPLSDSNQTNKLLIRAPDLYLYGALIAAEPYLWNDERVELWAQLYRSGVDLVNGMDRKISGPLVSRVVGATP